MKTPTHRPAIGLLVAMSLLVEAGCAQRPPEPATTNWHAIAEGLTGARKTIGVVALGPTQMMNDHWHDFDPAVKSWLAQGPTLTTRERGPSIGFERGIQKGWDSYIAMARQGDPRGVAMSIPLIPVWLAISGLIGEVAPGPEVQLARPLTEVVGADAVEPSLLDKRTVGEAIRDHVTRIAGEKSNHVFRTVPHEDARNRASMSEPVDALLTIRVVGIGLIGKGGDNPLVALKVHIWTDFDRTGFRPFEYVGTRRRLTAWAADNGRLLREELDRAVQTLAEQVVEGVFQLSSTRTPAKVYRVQARHAEAESHLKRSLAIGAHATAEGQIWDSYISAGVAAFQQGHYTEAEKQYEAALKAAEKFAPQDPRLATSLDNLGVAYFYQGRYAEAEPLYKRALAIFEPVLGPEDPHVATVLYNLALLYRAQGRYAEAEPLHKRALAIREKELAPEQPPFAIHLNNLASPFPDQGRYAEPEHPNVATLLNILGLPSQYAQAEPSYQRALAIRERAFGPERPRVANDLNTLAQLYHEQGRYAEAEPLYQWALAIRQRALGPGRPEVAQSMNNLAALLQDQERYAEAEHLFRRSLTILETAFGSEHWGVAASLNNLAALYHAQGRYAEVEPLYKRALAIREKTLGPEHPELVQGPQNHAALLRETGRPTEASKVETRAKAIRAKHAR